MTGMASEMALALVLVLMMWHGVWAQSGCSNALMNMAPCLNFVTGSATTPSPMCCSGLTGVVQTQPQCLCTMMNGGGAMAGFSVNQTLALALPAACNVQTPPVSQCNVASGPTTSVASPASAPVGSPLSDSTHSDFSSNNTPATTNTQSTTSQTNTPSSTGTGSKSTPSTTGASSAASTITSPLPVVMLVSLVVSFALRATKF